MKVKMNYLSFLHYWFSRYAHLKFKNSGFLNVGTKSLDNV